MLLDILAAILLISGFSHGFRKGLIHSAFSLLAILIGIGLALKGSYLVAAFLNDSFDISYNFLPVLAFIIVILITIIIFKITATILHNILKALALGLVNKIAGAALWTVIMALVASTMIWFADKNNLISKRMAKRSYFAYDYGMEFAPKALQKIGEAVPFFHDLFDELDELFDEPHRTA